uniref:Uncharacterized protein n=1 Tax=Panagrolaimus davidi TaxID=227884 RepID=A0A914Q2J2_9BILA
MTAIKCQIYFAFILPFISFIIFSDASDYTGEKELHDENISLMSELKDSLKSKDYDVQINALVEIRTLLSTKDEIKFGDEQFVVLDEKLDEIVENGLIPILIDCMHSKSLEIQERAAWILTHISIFSPHYAKQVVNAGGIQPFIYLMDSNNFAMKEETIWALQAIVHRSKEDRDFTISQGMIPKIVKIVMFDKPPSNIEVKVAELIKAILVHREISTQALKELLPAIKKLLDSKNDDAIDVILQSLYFAVIDDEVSQIFFDFGIPEKLVPFLGSENYKFRAIALPVIGNMCHFQPEKTKIFLDLGMLKYMPKLLDHKDTRENALMFTSKTANEEVKKFFEDYEIKEIQNSKIEL